MQTDNDGVELVIDSEDEFEADYEDPGRLGSADVQGAVVYTVDWTVAVVVDQIDANPDNPESQGMLVTSPPFQRRTAWTAERQSLFIESLMLGLPVPPLVLAESVKNPGQFYVLDGKQRLTAIQRFHDANDPLKLTGLELLKTELTGLTRAQIQESPDLRKYLRSLSTQPVRTVVVRNWRTPALLHLIFSRLNRASVPLASHELRQALFPGRFTDYINRRSAESSQLLKARRLTSPDFRLRDAETLLRYIAFRTNWGVYHGDLRVFLDRVLKGGNDHFAEISDRIEEIVADMERAIEATFQIFGDAAFLRYDRERSKYMPRFNVTVFDLMTWYFADERVRDLSLAASGGVREAFQRLSSESPQFSTYLTSTTKTKDAVDGRLSLWGEALGDVIGEALGPAAFQKPVLPYAPEHR